MEKIITFRIAGAAFIAVSLVTNFVFLLVWGNAHDDSSYDSLTLTNGPPPTKARHRLTVDKNDAATVNTTTDTTARGAITTLEEEAIKIPEQEGYYYVRHGDEFRKAPVVTNTIHKNNDHDEKDLLLLDAAISALGCNNSKNNNSNNTTKNNSSACIERAAMNHAKKEKAYKFHLEENIELAKKRAASEQPYYFQLSKLQQNRRASNESSLHPKLVGMDPKFHALEHWTTRTNNNNNNNTTTIGIAYPNIEIVGWPKSGTSQLYRILTTRPDTRKFHPTNKEFCSSSDQQDLFQWHKQVYKNNNKRYNSGNGSSRSSSSSSKSINGCIGMDNVLLRHSYLRLTGEQQKIILLFRDPADWMWATFNFWTDKHFDTNLNEPGMWTNEEQNYRSPEVFHELFAAGPTKMKAFKRFMLFRKASIQGVYNLWKTVGKENVLLLKSEDMQPHVVNETGGFLDKLSNFTGLDRLLFSDDVIFQYSNCNNAKGADSACGDKATSAYAVAGGREMLPETRELVYLYFWEECKLWSTIFGINYPGCVNVISS